MLTSNVPVCQPGGNAFPGGYNLACAMHRCLGLFLFLNSACGADALYVNANVITVDSSKPRAEAFAVSNGYAL